MSSITASAYDLHDFDRMFADEARTGPYLAAIAAAVRPGDVVVEIGTGTGYFAVACAKAGARHVYAIEVNPAVALGPAVAEANGCADRITFIHGYSTRIDLPERGDVLLEDLRGLLPLLWGRIPSLVDARDRLLKPSARLITARDELWAAPCRRPDRVTTLLGLGGDGAHGINREPVAAKLRSDIHRARVVRDDLLAAPARWGAIDYSDVRDPDIAGRCEWTVEQDGAFDGFAVWFNSELFGSHWIRNEPGAAHTVYGQAFFPLKQSIAARAGDHVSLDFRAHRLGEGYLFAWDTRHACGGRGLDEEGRGGNGAGRGAVTQFRQSTLGASLPLSLDALKRRGS
ncbi:MAG: 50S ribosomal protein L11 methyltransferase, partial [Gemmatimonadota bacterium]|nr:50S ribosomal protein L11 methyltransferase [Gemmatimonadota bacterium]